MIYFDQNLEFPFYPLRSIRRIEELIGRNRKDLKRIASHAGRYYRPFDRRHQKGEGKWRHIDNPTGELKEIQQRIHRNILTTIKFPEEVVGGVAGRSIRDNGEYHLRKPMLVTLDLRDCFPRISHKNIFGVYSKMLGCSNETASLLTRLTTFQRRLPQGAPTSPALANLSLLELQANLKLIAKQFNLSITFYIDDIAVSGNNVSEAIEPIINVIQKHGHAIRRKKIRRMPASCRQEVTGVIVNQKLSVSKERIKEVRKKIFDVAASKDILDHEIQSIWGKISFIKSISPPKAEPLTNLALSLLPNFGIGGKQSRTDEIRPCSCAKCHSYYPIE